MDVSKLNVEGEWLELEVENKDFGTFKVLIVPRHYSGLANMVMKDDMTRFLTTLVVDWNLKDGKKKIECTLDNKMKYLSVLASWKITNPKYAEKGMMFQNVGTEIIAFAQNIKNFTKNSKPISN